MKQELISKRIKEILANNGWTLTELAYKMDADLASASRWVNGKQNMTIKTIERMEYTLGEEIITVK